MRIKAKTKLADALGVGYPTILRYLAKEGAPTANKDGWDVDEVRDFISKNASRVEAMMAGTGENERAKLMQKRERLLDERTRQLELSNLQASGHLVAKDTVRETHTRIAARIKELCLKIENELPADTHGSDLANARKAWRVISDMILAAHQEAAEEWGSA